MSTEREQEFVSKIRAALDESSRALPPRVEQRLAKARAHALAQLRAEPPRVARTQRVLAGAHGFEWRPRFALALPFAILLLGLAGLYQWQERQRFSDPAEIDAAVLTDELPLKAYTDQGFQEFLHKAMDE